MTQSLVFHALQTCSVADALALTPSLRETAKQENAVHLAAFEIQGPAILLGRWQHASRVLEADHCASRAIAIHRRETAGTAGYVGPEGAVLFSLALPTMTSLVADTLSDTVINRNIRGFLQGFTRAGALAHYFGREWLALSKQPGALVGVEQAEDASVSVEILVGAQQSIELPHEACSTVELGISRYRGKSPVSWARAAPNAPPLSQRVSLIATTVAHRAERALHHATSALSPQQSHPVALDVTLDHHVACAIGHVDLGHFSSGELWIGGDVMLSSRARSRLLRALKQTPAQRESAIVSALADEVSLGTNVQTWLQCGALAPQRVRL
ncbi:MAG: hypothetical protein Q8Q09_05275 [Deltaproteobacteria bacterium]|nr:hypothetical protein [Deltaproteobacteria bacterium]